MAGVDITLTFEDGELRHVVSEARARLSDYSPAMDEIGSYLEDRTLERFETGEAPDGTPWLPSQRALDENGKTLVDRGHLLASINYETTPDAVTVGSNVIYAAIHQHGGKTGRGLAVDMPARPFLGVNDADLQEIELIVADFVSELGTGGDAR
ncbi:virion morphogenesis protein [Candidatus Phaeomarinobacter ectocarpi]|uniref:Virion morphogenesis protein n=1 Tax=Candidatus Phaeomarinibacter ectocarpi TaxID=1458461 RepID=X5MP27_9HYPH|nr:phage virion morphogenesis protein [Candidatus Phaeomarinobacter ectocarpi]CDO60811.1 virion morphogenesis protein [Candidatus Phaeomarinobacter ectocarpi]